MRDQHSHSRAQQELVAFHSPKQTNLSLFFCPFLPYRRFSPCSTPNLLQLGTIESRGRPPFIPLSQRSQNGVPQIGSGLQTCFVWPLCFFFFWVSCQHLTLAGEGASQKILEFWLFFKDQNIGPHWASSFSSVLGWSWAGGISNQPVSITPHCLILVGISGLASVDI